MAPKTRARCDKLQFVEQAPNSATIGSDAPHVVGYYGTPAVPGDCLRARYPMYTLSPLYPSHLTNNSATHYGKQFYVNIN